MEVTFSPLRVNGTSGQSLYQYGDNAFMPVNSTEIKGDGGICLDLPSDDIHLCAYYRRSLNLFDKPGDAVKQERQNDNARYSFYAQFPNLAFNNFFYDGQNVCQIGGLIEYFERHDTFVPNASSTDALPADLTTFMVNPHNPAMTFTGIRATIVETARNMVVQAGYETKQGTINKDAWADSVNFKSNGCFVGLDLQSQLGPEFSVEGKLRSSYGIGQQSSVAGSNELDMTLDYYDFAGGLQFGYNDSSLTGSGNGLSLNLGFIAGTRKDMRMVPTSYFGGYASIFRRILSFSLTRYENEFPGVDGFSGNHYTTNSKCGLYAPVLGENAFFGLDNVPVNLRAFCEVENSSTDGILASGGQTVLRGGLQLTVPLPETVTRETKQAAVNIGDPQKMAAPNAVGAPNSDRIMQTSIDNARTALTDNGTNLAGVAQELDMPLLYEDDRNRKSQVSISPVRRNAALLAFAIILKNSPDEAAASLAGDQSLVIAVSKESGLSEKEIKDAVADGADANKKAAIMGKLAKIDIDGLKNKLLKHSAIRAIQKLMPDASEDQIKSAISSEDAAFISSIAAKSEEK